MDTSEFENTFLGQPAIISINENGTLVSIKLKHFPSMNIELSEEYKRDLEIEYADDIRAVLKENYQDSKEQDRHIHIESSKGKFI